MASSASEPPDDIDAFLREQCSDPETSYIYGYHFGWNDARSLPWWKRLFMRRFSFLPDGAGEWPGADNEGAERD